jgi:nickel-dependent lactate racemase
MKSMWLLYDRGKIDLQIPDSWDVLCPDDPPAMADSTQALRNALNAPVGCEPLASMARKADKTKPAVIVVSDITRPVPNRVIVPVILEVLHAAGYTKENITLLIATGMHRPSTSAERVELLGESIVENYRVVDHRADAAETLIELPQRTSSGTCVRIDKTYFDAGLRILTGFIEPHFMAGFSGGRKSICPGLVDLGTLNKFHGAEFLSSPDARLGNLLNNPCHAEALDAARIVRPDFIVNVTVDAEGRITGVFAGDLEEAHAMGMTFVRKTMTVKVDRPYDVVFTSGGGYPLDTTFYQSVKGMVAAGEFVRAGGKVIIASGCAAGIGSTAYRDLLFAYDDYKLFLKDIFSTDKTRLDQWQFQMQTRVLKKTEVSGLIMVCDHIDVDDLGRCHVTPAQDVVGEGPIGQQLRYLIEFIAKTPLRVAFLPRGPYILPELASGCGRGTGSMPS